MSQVTLLIVYLDGNTTFHETLDVHAGFDEFFDVLQAFVSAVDHIVLSIAFHVYRKRFYLYCFLELEYLGAFFVCVKLLLIKISYKHELVCDLWL